MAKRREREWVGGRMRLPASAGAAREPGATGMELELVVWVELPRGIVVRADVRELERGEPGLGELLRAAIEEPLEGRPRRPTRVRVAEASVAAELRLAFGGKIPVEVAPTPELDPVFQDFLEHVVARRELASYLAGGRVSPAAVGELFRASAPLWAMAPWKKIDDDQLIRLDAPELGLRAACVSIIGRLGEVSGFVIFPSLDAYEAMVDARRARAAGARIVSLNFMALPDLSAEMRQEIEHHHWPLPAPDVAPAAVCVDARLAPLDPDEADYRLLAAVAAAIPTFVARSRAWFEGRNHAPRRESIRTGDGPMLQLSVPHEARGGGVRAADDPARWHEIDQRLVDDLVDYAARRFRKHWKPPLDAFHAPEDALQLAVPWSVFGQRVQGRSIADRYAEAHAARLRPDESAWLGAQRAAWLSLWEVTAVQRGTGLRLLDLLTGETRDVRERLGSQTLRPRDVVLGRVVGHAGLSLLCGLYPRSLPPTEAAALLRRVRARLGLKRSATRELLREESVGRDLIRAFEAAVAALDARRAIPPTLTNTAGDPLLLTTDHFAFEPRHRAEIASRLAALPGCLPPEGTARERQYVFVDPADPGQPGPPGPPGQPASGRTILAQARLAQASLAVDTNSIARADAIRATLEAACAPLLRHRVREHADPTATLADRLARGDAPAAPAHTPAEQAAILQAKQQHYAAWLDSPIPALGGRTPRACTRTRAARRKLDVLLKELENSEALLPERERFDVRGLRRELGMEGVER